jgi:hypothetical protein
MDILSRYLCVGNTLGSVVYAQHRINCIDDDHAWNQPRSYICIHSALAAA